MAWMEDFQRALSEYGVTVIEIPGKGRGLVTTRDFAPGEVIIFEEPYAAAPNEDSVGLVCDSCFSSNHVEKCSACQVACYCGPTCERNESKLHRVECESLVALAKKTRKMLTPTIHLMVRLIVHASLQQDQVMHASETNNYNLIKALESLWLNKFRSFKKMSDIGGAKHVTYAQMAGLVSKVLPSLVGYSRQMGLAEVVHNFSRLSCNAHTIYDAELRPYGTGLFPVVSMINHSCVPNSVLIFEGRKAHIRATEHIPKNTEVSISYIETAAAKEKRQNDLKQYFFTCSCSRCLKSYNEEDAFLEGYRCCDSNCTGASVYISDKDAFECHQCGTAIDPDELTRRLRETAQLFEKATPVVFKNNFKEAYSIYKAVEEIQCDVLHPLSLKLLETRDILMKISIELNEWESALTYCKRTVEAYQRVYPAIHPRTGLRLYECGKIEWLLNKKDDALVSYTKAADILRITHGTTSPFMKELLATLEEARTM